MKTIRTAIVKLIVKNVYLNILNFLLYIALVGKNKERSFDRQMEYLEGLYGRDQPQSDRTTAVSIQSGGLAFLFGRRDFDFVLWEDIVAIDFVGSTNPAFKSVSKALYGFPGLQSISSKEVRTGAKTFMTVSYTHVVRASGNMRFDVKGTVRFYVKDCSHNDLEVELAKYMHLVEKNAQRFAKRLVKRKQKSKESDFEDEDDVENLIEDLDEEDDEDLIEDSDDDLLEDSDAYTTPDSNNPTIAEELKDLVAMLDRGLITESEFHQVKKRLLENS